MTLEFTTHRVATLRHQVTSTVESVRRWGGNPEREAIGDVASYLPVSTALPRRSQGRRTVAVQVGNVRSLASAWDEMSAVVGNNPHIEHSVFGMLSSWGHGESMTVDTLFNETRLVLAALGMRQHKYVMEAYDVGATRMARVIVLRLNHRTGWAVESPYFDLPAGQIGNVCLEKGDSRVTVEGGASRGLIT